MEFQEAQSRLKNLSFRPLNESLLELYGLYKQATVGNCNTSKPMFWDQKGSSKWDAWQKCHGLGQETAMDRYVNIVNGLDR